MFKDVPWLWSRQHSIFSCRSECRPIFLYPHFDHQLLACNACTNRWWRHDLCPETGRLCWCRQNQNHRRKTWTATSSSLTPGHGKVQLHRLTVFCRLRRLSTFFWDDQTFWRQFRLPCRCKLRFRRSAQQRQAVLCQWTRQTFQLLCRQFWISSYRHLRWRRHDAKFGQKPLPCRIQVGHRMSKNWRALGCLGSSDTVTSAGSRCRRSQGEQRENFRVPIFWLHCSEQQVATVWRIEMLSWLCKLIKWYKCFVCN